MSEAAEIDSCDKAGAGGRDPASLEAIIAAVREQNTAQQAVIAQLQERIAELDRRAWPEQWQQRQTAFQRRPEEAGSRQQSAGTVRKEGGRAERAPGRDLAPERDARCHDRSFPPNLRRVRRGAERRDGHGPHCPAGVRPARTTAADRDRTPRPSLLLRGVRHAYPC